MRDNQQQHGLSSPGRHKSDVVGTSAASDSSAPPVASGSAKQSAVTESSPPSVAVPLRRAAATLDEARGKMEGVELANNLRNLLRSTKGGIPLKRLDAEFYTFAGVHIPLGAFRDLEQLLTTMPDVCTVKPNERGQLYVHSAKHRGHQTATVVGGHKHTTPGATANRTGTRRTGQPSGGRGSGVPASLGGRRAPQAPNNPRAHYTARPRTGPSGRLPRRLPQSSRQQHQHHQHRRHHLNKGGGGGAPSSSHNGIAHGNGPGGNWRSGNRSSAGNAAGSTTGSGHHHHENGGSGGGGGGSNTNNHHNSQQVSSLSGRRGNMVWINPSLQYATGVSANETGGRSARVYRERPNAIPIVDPRSRRVVSGGGGRQGGQAYSSPTLDAAARAGGGSHSLAMLEAFARASGLPPPEFQLMESKTNKKAAAADFLCTVDVDGVKYKSYPDYRPTAALAKEAAAAKALAALGITKDNLQQRVAEKQASLPAADMSDESNIDCVAEKIAQLLEKKPNGVFSNSVSQLFAENFKQKLPDDWQIKVVGHKLLDFVPNAVANCDVVYRRCAINGSTASSIEGGIQLCGQVTIDALSVGATASTPAAGAAPQLPALTISDEQFMFVTTLIVDASNFYGRIERDEYHTLVADMDVYYNNEANLAQQKLDAADRPVVGALYAVFDESWHRVQCVAVSGDDDVSESIGGAEFRYVDLGLSETIARSRLVHLAYDFYTVPFLSIQLRLEEFDDASCVSDSKRPSVIALMQRLMQNRILWAVPSPGVDLAQRPLPVRVYDTGDACDTSAVTPPTTPEQQPQPHVASKDQIDVNTEVYRAVATPVIFPAPVIAKGYLSCVLPDGVVYLQIEDFGLNELRALTVEPASEKPVETVEENKVYCAQLEGNWYRCVATNIESDKEIDIEFIDYGNKDTVDVGRMFPLKTGSHIEDLPPQAVRAHMTDLQPVTDVWSVEELAKITDFCPEDQLLIIKVSACAHCQGRDCDDSIQHVDVFKRTQPNDELVSVNLRLGEELKALSDRQQLRQQTTNSSESIDNRSVSRLAIGSLSPLAPVYKRDSPPVIGDTFSVHVISAASPLAFVVQPFNTSVELANLRAQMQLYYGKQENRLALSEFEIGAGEFFACLQDEIWERAYVEKASGAPSPDGATCTLVVCYFVDNGAYQPLTVSATSIQPLHTQFRQLSRQAIQSRLHEVAPRQGAADFDPMDCITFQKHITGRDLEAKVRGFSEDSRIASSPTFSLALDLFDEDLDLRQTYADMSLLDIAEENKA